MHMWWVRRVCYGCKGSPYLSPRSCFALLYGEIFSSRLAGGFFLHIFSKYLGNIKCFQGGFIMFSELPLEPLLFFDGSAEIGEGCHGCGVGSPQRWCDGGRSSIDNEYTDPPHFWRDMLSIAGGGAGADCRVAMVVGIPWAGLEDLKGSWPEERWEGRAVFTSGGSRHEKWRTIGKLNPTPWTILPYSSERWMGSLYAFRFGTQLL